MEVALIILCMWYAEIRLPLNYLLGDGPCLRQLEGMLDSIKSSEYHLLTLIWNVSRALQDVFTEDLAAILAGVRRALQLPPQPESIKVLGPLSLSISHLLGKVHVQERRSLDERRTVSEAADITIKLLRCYTITRPIFGRRNNLMLSCARATEGIRPATGWLALYAE
jgi:hypothetical protein